MKIKGDFEPLHRVQKSSRSRFFVLKYGIPLILLVLVLMLLNWQSIESYFDESKAPSIEPQIEVSEPLEGTTNQAKDLHFEGVDSNNQPYTLVAKEGFEFEDDHSELKNPHFDLKLNSGEAVTLSAERAKINRSDQKIELIGNVVVTHSTGYEFKTAHAWINLSDSSAYGSDPVTGTGPNGDISSQSGFKLTDKGKKIMFMGRPELFIVKGAK